MTARFALFLRGINVAGIRVPMADLRVCLEALGLQDVKTYLNTGNVTFASDRTPEALKKSIEKALTDRFKYEAFVLLYPFTALQPAIKGCPFTVDDTHHRYAIFCGSQEVIDELMTHHDKLDPALEQIAAGPHGLYWRVPKGSTLDTPFSKVMSKPRYKSVTTNRNLNTVEKMIED